MFAFQGRHPWRHQSWPRHDRPHCLAQVFACQLCPFCVFRAVSLWGIESETYYLSPFEMSPTLWIHFISYCPGLANRTADKQKPGPLELTLFFKVPWTWYTHYLLTLWTWTHVSVSFPTTIHFKPKSLCRKQCGRNAWSARKLQFGICCSQPSPITIERPQIRPTHWRLYESSIVRLLLHQNDSKSFFLFVKAWKVKDDLKRLIYSLIRAPQELIDMMKLSADLYKWEHGGGDSCVKLNFYILLLTLGIQPCQPGWPTTWRMTSPYLGIACALKMWLIHGGGISRHILFDFSAFHCFVFLQVQI